MARSTRRDDPTALMGRDLELDRLKSSLHEAIEGRGRIELVSGEPGIGKTRLLQEISAYAESCGVAVFTAGCPDDTASPPYWPWSQVLRGVLPGMSPRTVQAAIRPDAALAVDAFPWLDIGVPRPARRVTGLDSPETARLRLFDAVARLLTARARESPVAVLLDDLHWADEPSLKLLVHVCAEPRQAAILLVGTYRELGFEPGHPLPGAVGALIQKRWCGHLPLRGLTRAESGRLLASGIGRTSAQPLVDSVFHLTDGNPLFITQIARLLAQDPEAHRGPGGLAVGVRDVIARRLSRLSARCNELLAEAAVLGNEFSVSLIAAMDGSRSRGGKALDQAVGEGIVAEVSDAPGRYRFCHILIRDAVLACLPPGRRASLHARAYEVLERRWREEAEEHAPELLVHAIQSQAVLGPIPAAREALTAGDTALRAHAFEEARKLYTEGLTALRDQPMDDLKAALTLASARARCVLDMTHESRVLLLQAFEYYEARQNTAKMVEVLTDKYIMADSLLLPLYQRTIPRVDPDSLDRGYLLASYGVLKAFCTSVHASGDVELREAHRLARLHGDDWLEMRVLWLSAFADTLRVDSDWGERLERLQQARLIAHRLGDCHDEMWVLGRMADELLGRGRLDEAERISREMGEISRRRGDRMDQLRARTMQLEICHYRGEWQSVRTLCDEIIESSPPLRVQAGYPLCLRCVAAAEVGDTSEAGRDLLRLVETTRLVPNAPAQIFVNCGLAILGICRITRGRDYLDDAEAFAGVILNHPNANPGQLRGAHDVLARLCLVRGDLASADVEYRYLTELLARTPPEGRPYSWTHHLLGALAALRGDVSGALVHYGQAGANPYHAEHERAWIGLEMAGLLAARGDRGDREQARALLASCLGVARRLGMSPLAMEAEVALDALGSRHPEAPEGLSAREAEVLALVVRGLTNREIGHKLFIATKTVDTHVGSILAKTGAANRTEAAAWAIRIGLPGV